MTGEEMRRLATALRSTALARVAAGSPFALDPREAADGLLRRWVLQIDWRALPTAEMERLCLAEIEALARGDLVLDAQFDHVAEKHHSWLLALARSRLPLRLRADAEDVVAGTWAEHRSTGAWRGWAPLAVRSLLRSTVERRAIDLIRRRPEVAAEPEERPLSVARPRESLESLACRLAATFAVLEEGPEKGALAYVLYLAGLTVQEIAEATNPDSPPAPATVRARIRRVELRLDEAGVETGPPLSRPEERALLGRPLARWLERIEPRLALAGLDGLLFRLARIVLEGTGRGSADYLEALRFLLRVLHHRGCLTDPIAWLSTTHGADATALTRLLSDLARAVEDPAMQALRRAMIDSAANRDLRLSSALERIRKEYARDLEEADRLLALAERSSVQGGDRVRNAIYLEHRRGNQHALRGDLDRAETLYRAALAMAVACRPSSVHHLSKALGRVSLLRALSGDIVEREVHLAKAETDLDRAAGLASGYRRGAVDTDLERGTLMLARGDACGAAGFFRRAGEGAEALGAARLADGAAWGLAAADPLHRALELMEQRFGIPQCWFGDTLRAVLKSEPYARVLDTVPGLAAAYAGARIAAEQAGALPAFERVVAHSLRAAHAVARRFRGATFAEARAEGAGLYRIASAGQPAECEDALRRLAAVNRAAISRGDRPALLALLHDGLGLKAVPPRSGHEERVGKWLFDHRLGRDAVGGDMRLAALACRCASLLADACHRPHANREGYLRFQLVAAAGRLSVTLHDPAFRARLLDLLCLLSVADVAAIRTGELRSPSQLAGIIDARDRLAADLERDAAEGLLDDSTALGRKALASRDRSVEESVRRLATYCPGPELVETCRRIHREMSRLDPFREEALRRVLPLVPRLNLFDVPLTALAAASPGAMVFLVASICAAVDPAELVPEDPERYVEVGLTHDAVPIHDCVAAAAFVTRFCDRDQVEAWTPTAKVEIEPGGAPVVRVLYDLDLRRPAG